jgi:hypothetical protein
VAFFVSLQINLKFMNCALKPVLSLDYPECLFKLTSSKFEDARVKYFRNFLKKTDDRMLMKMDHYLDIYDRMLKPWRGRDVSFLEIGVYKGGSLRM